MPQHNSNREFAYQPRWGIIIAAAVFFTACGLLIRSEAASNDRGLVINGIIELSRERATIFYWVLSWMSFAFVALAAVMLVVRILNPQKVVLSSDGVYAPRWAWSRQPTFIRYADVISMSTYSVSGQEFLKVVHARGKHNLAASMFKSKSSFEDFREELARRLRTPDGKTAP
jgi:hypothetical protein